MTQTSLPEVYSPERDSAMEETSDMWVADGLNAPDLGASDDAPPAYGEHHDQLTLSQVGFEAGAAVTGDGRVDININQKNRRLAELLGPTLRNQLAPEVKLPAGPLPPAYIPPSLGGQPGQTPPPKLNVVIQIVGSRGDVQPFVALGKVLKDTYGHRIRLATHATFQKFVEENGLEFFNIGGDPAELMAFMVKNPGLMPGIGALKSGEITKRRQGIEEMLLGCWRSCVEAGNGMGPAHRRHRPDELPGEGYSLSRSDGGRPFVADAIIANPPSFAHIHLAEKMGIPLHMMFTMPWTPTRAFPHPLANIQSSNTDDVMTNYVSYALVEMMTWQGLGDVINRFRTAVLDLDPLSLLWAPGLLTRLRIPTTYCWSPALIPKPNDWMGEISISGFYFLNLASAYTPEPDLAAFLEAGPPPVYIGFGSIVVDDPNALTKIIFDAVSITGVRALVSKGWGGLGVDSIGLPDGVFMLGNCPHDWLFKHVSAVVHHGGAGTSAAGINLGRPTVVVPFFGDQPFWGAMIAKAGAGPAPIPYSKLTGENLAAAIQEALKPETQARAKELGEKIREEKGADEGGKSFHQFLNTDKMRCSLAPSRVAVWRVRRTQTRLSTLAAATLVQEGIIKYSDMKLYRSTEYNTEDQPWDPISAVTSTLIGDIGNITMAVADFPRDIFKAAGRPRKNTSTKDGSSSGAPTSAAASSSTSLVPSLTNSTAESSIPPIAELPGSMPDVTMIPWEPARSPAPSREPPPVPSDDEDGEDDAPTPNQIGMDRMIGAGRGVGRIVNTGIKSPMNFCMGLARGFHNVPKLYNDDTVRTPDKVTDFASGLKVAGKEFGLGLYDGISGLVTQPVRGASKEGGVGLLKGVGKGVGGLVVKPAAGFWSIPAYTMQGVHAEVRNRFRKSSLNYIIASRVLEGEQHLASSTAEEQRDILIRWRAKKEDLKGFYLLKQKEKNPSEADGGQTPPPEEVAELAATTSPRPGWLHSRNLSTEGGRRRFDSWIKRQADNKSATAQSWQRGASDPTLEDEEFERAIRASVSQTSRGDPEEDARIEQSIRASVKAMKRIAEERADDKGRGQQDLPTSGESSTALDNITDEEYQALIEEAVRQSLVAQNEAEQREYTGEAADAEELRRGIEESKALAAAAPPPVAGDDEEQMRRAIEESEREHREQTSRGLTEEQIVMEYVMKQSLAEEEYRRSKAKGKGVSRGTDDEDGAEDDEDLRRALEESLKMSHGGEGGPASSSYGYGQSAS